MKHKKLIIAILGLLLSLVSFNLRAEVKFDEEELLSFLKDIDTEIKCIDDSLTVMWDKFLTHCQAKEYQEACSLFRNNIVEFFHYIGDPVIRYEFLNQVVSSLLYEYLPEEEALAEYLTLLELEYEIDMDLWAANFDSPCVETLPFLIYNMGLAYADMGDIESAKDQVGTLALAILSLDQDEINMLYFVATYQVEISLVAGDVWSAIKSYEECISVLSEIAKTEDADIDYIERIIMYLKGDLDDVKKEYGYDLILVN